MKKYTTPILTLMIILSVIGITVSSYKNTRNKTNLLISECIQKTACPDCNVILISADSLRADHLKSFGYVRDTAPHLEQFIRKGTLFKNYFTTSYLTPITEMSVHTGMYPTSNGVVDFNTYLPTTTSTLAELLNAQGYYTQAYITSPEFMNFEAMKKNFSRGFDSYDFFKTYARNKKDEVTGILSHKENLKNKLTQLKTKNKFFLWIPVGIMHWPYGYGMEDRFGDPNYDGYFKNKMIRWHNILSNIYDKKIYPNGEELTDADIQHVKDLYDNGIYQFDIFFEELMNQIEEQGLQDKTIIIIESEHGEGLGEHEYIAHYDIMDTQIHTPLFIYTPKKFQKQISTNMTSSIDILPTILELAGMSPPEQVQGSSLVPAICGYKDEKNDAIYSQRVPLWEEGLLENELKSLGVTIGQERHKDIAIRTAEWKLILRTSREIMSNISWWKVAHGIDITYPEMELYHVSSDPLEQNNVLDQFPDIAKKLKERIVEWESNLPEAPQDVIKRYPKLQYYF